MSGLFARAPVDWAQRLMDLHRRLSAGSLVVRPRCVAIALCEDEWGSVPLQRWEVEPLTLRPTGFAENRPSLPFCQERQFGWGCVGACGAASPVGTRSCEGEASPLSIP